MTPWFDTHVHLDRYEPEARAALQQRAQAAGVEIIAVAVDLASSLDVSAIEGVVGRVVGAHPRHASQWFEPELRQLAQRPGVLAIGECGFDAEGPAWELQERCFRTQCAIARELGRALVVHVDGDGAFEQLQRNVDALHGLRVVRHYFTGDEAQAAWHRERAHWLSFGNPLRKSAQLAAIAATYPPHRLLLETDSYPLPGRTTEPADVLAVGEALAMARGWSINQARRQLAKNTQAAFGLE